ARGRGGAHPGARGATGTRGEDHQARHHGRALARRSAGPRRRRKEVVIDTTEHNGSMQSLLRTFTRFEELGGRVIARESDAPPPSNGAPDDDSDRDPGSPPAG